MSLHVWNCRCGRRWFQFRRAQWDSNSAITTYCPACRPDFVETLGDWVEL